MRPLLRQAAVAGGERRRRHEPQLGQRERVGEPVLQPCRPDGCQDRKGRGDRHPSRPALARPTLVAGGRRGVQRLPTAASAARRLPADHPPGRQVANVAGGGIPFRERRRNAIPRLERWHALADGLRAQRFGVGEGAATARLLVRAKYQPSTQRKYFNACERFVNSCVRTCARALPASPETVVCYMASLFESKTCQPDTINSYLAAVRAVHRLAGEPSPTDDALVPDAKVGCRRLHVQAEGALPAVRGPLPPEAVLQLAHVGLATTSPDLQRKCTGLVLAFLMFNRPGAAANMRAMDLRLLQGSFQAQVPVYKMGVLKRGARLAFTIPVAAGGWLADPALRLVRRVWLAHYRAGRPAAAHLFPRWASSGPATVRARAPPLPLSPWDYPRR